MRLESNIIVDRASDEVWRFPGNAANIGKWDRGVAGVESKSSLEFDTLAPEGMAAGPDRGRMSYRVADAGENRCTVLLTSSTGNARFFKTAEWRFRTEPASAGTLLAWVVGPLLYAKRGAVQMDLVSLKRALERQGLRGSFPGSAAGFSCTRSR